MSKWYCLVVVSVFAVACAANAEVASQTPIGPKTVRMESAGDSGARFILELLPVSFLFSPDLEDFEAVGGGGEIITIDGTGSWIPNARAGVSIGMDTLILDITGGGGILWNNAFSGPFYVGDIAARCKIGDHWTLGPHAGILYFSNITWEGDTSDGDSTGTEEEFEFSDTTGWMAGVTTTFGGKKLFGFLSLDYVSAEMDVEAADPTYWTLNDDTLDLSGFAIQAGIAWRF